MGTTILSMDDSWNDYLWIQCFLRGGSFMVLIFVGPVVLFCCCACIAVVCCLAILISCSSKGYKKFKNDK
jgi:hypothetical protein